jgi:hypothetical protein
MRSVWSTLVAVTLVVAGVRVAAGPAGHGHSELHAAKCLRVAPTVRRAHDQLRPLDALVAVSPSQAPYLSRHALAPAQHAASSQPVGRHWFVRSSRGPPRA